MKFFSKLFRRARRDTIAAGDPADAMTPAERAHDERMKRQETAVAPQSEQTPPAPPPPRPINWVPPRAVPRYTPPRSARVQWRDGSFPMPVVGESHYQAALIGLVGPYSRYGVDIEAVARIARDPSNPHDSNAVKVTVEGRLVGHLPRDQAERVSAQMAEDGIAAANCRARIKGGWRTNQRDEGLYGVSLGINSWGWIDFGLGKVPPTPPQRPKPAPEGPLKGLRVVIDDAETGGDLQREFAARGAQIMAAVGKTTDYLVLADDHGWDLESPGPGGTGNVWTAAKYRDEGRKIRLITLSEARELGA